MKYLPALIVFALPGAVLACSIIIGPWGYPQFPWWSADGFPTNGLFASSLRWQDINGDRLELVVDETLSDRYGIEFRRPADGPLAPNDTFYPDEPSTCDVPPCEQVLAVADEPDETPPQPAVVADVRTLLVGNPSNGNGFSCADADTLELTIEGDDDTTPDEHLMIVAYLGEDETTARTTDEVALTFAFHEAEARLANITLGLSVNRQRDGEPFRSSEPFCFAVALLDWAGNEGERSEAVCLDTTDPDDPTVEWVESRGCSGTPGSTLAAGLAALWLCTRRRMSRRR